MVLWLYLSHLNPTVITNSNTEFKLISGCSVLLAPSSRAYTSASGETVRDGWGWVFNIDSPFFWQMYTFPESFGEILVLLQPVTKILGNLWVTDPSFSLQDCQWLINWGFFGLPLGFLWKSVSVAVRSAVAWFFYSQFLSLPVCWYN